MASNIGGVWERQIRSARRILSAQKSWWWFLSDESLRYLTLLVEVEGIINSRPITCESIGDVNSIISLSPMQLLSSKTSVVMPPPGTFQKEGMYCRKQWRRVQHLPNEFWTWWRKEVFATLQTTQKWNQTKRNLEMPQATWEEHFCSCWRKKIDPVIVFLLFCYR